jgi:ribokinase
MPSLLTIGDTTIDTFLKLKNIPITSKGKADASMLLPYGGKVAISDSMQAIGGGAANVAVAAKKLGHDVSIMTELGADPNGETALAALQKFKVNTQCVSVNKSIETRYSVVLNADSERTILSYHSNHKYAFKPLPSTDWIYYTSLGKGFEKVEKKLRAHLKKRPQTMLAMNPGSYQLEYAMPSVRNMLQEANVLFVNKEEATAISNSTTRASISLLMKKLHKLGVPHVVITDSVRGAYASDQEYIWHMNTYPHKPVAKTGAGDAFASGYLSAIMYNKSIPEALEWGSANAGSVVQKFGAQCGLCSRKGIQQIRAANTNISAKIL